MRKEFQVGIMLLSLVAVIMFSGCQRAYYSTMEKFGKHKRDILVDRVTQARDSQEEAKEQFKSALEQFTEVLNFQGGELEEKYKKLNAEYEKSRDKAGAVGKRIDDVKSVAKALFKEWRSELEEYSSDSLRESSEKKLEITQQKYEELIGAMERAESKINPVLTAFKDQVLFLKHNLNAQAIASLQDELGTMENNITLLIKEMEKSIAEANDFINAMTGAES